VAWSPDGQQLASGSFEGIITIWDVKTGQSTQILDEHVLPGRRSQSVLCLAWSSDGRLAAGLADQRIIVWDLKTGASPQILSGHTNPVHSIAWSDDGQLASSSIVAFIWDLNRGKPALTLNGLTVITSVAWSPDGRLASSTDDGAIILWNLKTGQSAQTIKAHTGPINSISWSSLGQLASGSDDGIIKITRGDLTGVDPCNKIIRNLTIQEWREYVGYLSIYQPACPNLYDPTLSQRHARSYFLVVMLLFVLAASLRVLFNFTWPSRDSMQSRKS
jgi:WD40 repeat protein